MVNYSDNKDIVGLNRNEQSNRDDVSFLAGVMEKDM